MDRFDVVVLGSGAAALAAAATAAGHGAGRVGVFEKADVVGGTSAMSGGMIWIPCNHQMDATGTPDSRDDVLAYLESLSHGMILPELAEAYVDTGPEMLRWFEDHTPVMFEIVESFPDYHPEHPGGSVTGGRSLECPLFDFNELGDWSERVAQGPQMAPHVLMNETSLGRGGMTTLPADVMAEREAANLRGCGQALVGRLLRACLDLDVELATGHRATELDHGRRHRRPGFDSRLTAGHAKVAASAVVLGTGGFEHNRELVRDFIRGPLERTVAIETNTGDGLKMAMRAGASIANMQEAWWVPIMDVPDDDGELFSWLVNRERVRPRSIMVNRTGRRFANEAANYNAFGAAFHELDPTSFEYRNLPAYLVMDHELHDAVRDLPLQGRRRRPRLAPHRRHTRRPRGRDRRRRRLAWSRPLPGGTHRWPTSTTPTSAAAAASTTPTGATAPEPAPPPSGHSTPRRTTPCRCGRERSAPRADHEQTATPRCSTSTAT